MTASAARDCTRPHQRCLFDRLAPGRAMAPIWPWGIGTRGQHYEVFDSRGHRMRRGFFTSSAGRCRARRAGGASRGLGRDAQFDARFFLQRRHNVEEVLCARIAARCEHAMQALGGFIDCRRQCFEAHRRVDQIAQDGLAGGGVPGEIGVDRFGKSVRNADAEGQSEAPSPGTANSDHVNVGGRADGPVGRC